MLYEGSRLLYVEQEKEDSFDTSDTRIKATADGSVKGVLVDRVGVKDKIRLRTGREATKVSEVSRGVMIGSALVKPSNNKTMMTYKINKNGNYNKTTTNTRGTTIVRRRLLEKNAQQQPQQQHRLPWSPTHALDTSFRLRGSSLPPPPPAPPPPSSGSRDGQSYTMGGHRSSPSSLSSIPYVSASTSHREAKRAAPGEITHHALFI